MTDPGQSGCSASFAKTDVTAAPECAAQIRHEFSDWLRGHFTLDAIKASDVVLAVNEALANAAEFAYVTAQQAGVMHVRADYDGAAAVLTVTVTDEGAWRTDRSGDQGPYPRSRYSLDARAHRPGHHRLDAHRHPGAPAMGSRLLDTDRCGRRDARSELRKPHDLNEELVDLPHRTHELVQVDGFGDVGVRVQLVAAQDVFLRR